MTIRIIYFSGTGNTAYIVKELEKSLISLGNEVSIIAIEDLYLNKASIQVMDADLVGIAFPVYGLNPPWIIEKTLKAQKLPLNKTCFIIKTAGDPLLNGGSTVRLQKLLKSRQWKIQYEALVPMPANMIIRYDNSTIKLIIKIALKQVDKIANDLNAGIKSVLPSGIFMNFLSLISVMGFYGAGLGGRYWKVTDKCIKCKKCVLTCPTENITLENDKFIFHNRCVICLRCSFNCPVQAYTHKILGSRFWIRPYNLQTILADNQIFELDVEKSKSLIVKRFVRFWRLNNLLD